MAISKIGGTGSDYWELISSVTPTSGAAAVNFTGLSPYKKLMVVSNGVNLNGSATLAVRLNNDSGNNYTFRSWESTATIKTSSFTSSITFTGSTTAQTACVVAINNCDNAGLKVFDYGWGSYASINFFLDKGIYLASAIVTQVNVITSSTFNGTGTMALYGVK